jgi:mono/diheme cytochrome c family protein
MKVKLIAVISSIVSVMIIALSSCQSDEQMEFTRYYTNGQVVYQQHCQNCHGQNGEGLNGLIPPLTDSTFLKNNKNNLSCFIKNGLKQKITIGSREFEGQMPANDLAPIDVAKVLTYVTNSFGNKLGTINLQAVEADLKNCK